MQISAPILSFQDVVEVSAAYICSGGTGVLYMKKGYIGHPLFYAKFWPYSIKI